MSEKEKIQELQLLEQNLQNFLYQKQAFQVQLLEAENALEEIKNAKDKVYKFIGSIIVESEKEVLKSELEEKQKILNIRIKSFEKQESLIREKIEKIQSEVLKSMENNENRTRTNPLAKAKGI